MSLGPRMVVLASRSAGEAPEMVRLDAQRHAGAGLAPEHVGDGAAW
jgi:hypothetical protein